MTEYIVIVALVAIGAIAVYTAFGDTVRAQMASISKELAGDDGNAQRTEAGTSATTAAGATKKTLKDYGAGGGNGMGGGGG
jgi:Flp pilus assembly pilin Flp